MDNTSSVQVSTDEGTWMNLDVSPDGKHIVFDMLGDIVLIPIEGGKTVVLLEGRAWEAQPRFSQDGTQRVVISPELFIYGLEKADA